MTSVKSRYLTPDLGAATMAKDPTAVANKWATNLGGATTSITAGVNAVTVAPGQRAAAASQLWLNRVTASLDKWTRNVSAVTLQQWQAAMINKGIPRISSGAQAAIPKMTAFMTQWLPYVEQGAATVRAMPKNSLADSKARAAAMIDFNAAFVRKPYGL